MVNTQELETNLNDKCTKEGDVWTIVSAGRIETKVDEKTSRKKKTLVIDVENGSQKLEYTLGKKARESLETAFGTDTTKWVGKQFSVKFVLMQIGDKELNVIKPIPLVAVKK